MATLSEFPIYLTNENKRNWGFVSDANWDMHPLCIPYAQVKMLDLSKIHSILSGLIQLPSASAGFKDTCNPLIQEFDQKYLRAINSYRTFLAQASASDFEEIKNRGLANQTLKKAMQNPTLCDRIDMALQAIAQIFSGPKISDADQAKECSAYRLSALQYINQSELVRRKEMKKQLLSRCLTLIDGIQEIKKTQGDYSSKTEELQTLIQFFDKTFPLEPFPSIENSEMSLENLTQIIEGKAKSADLPIESLRKKWTQDELKQLKSELKLLDQKNHELSQNIIGLRKTLQAKQEELEVKEKKIIDLNNKITEQEKQLALRQSKLDEYKKIGELCDELEKEHPIPDRFLDLGSKVYEAEINKELQRLKTGISALVQQIGSLKTERDALQTQNRELKVQIDQLSRQKDELALTLANVTRERDEMQLKIIHLNQSIQEQANELREKTITIDTLKTQNTGLKDEIGQLSQQKTKLVAELTNITQQRDELHLRIVDLNRTIEEQTNSVKTLQAQNNGQRDEINQLGRQKDELASMLANVTRERDDMKLKFADLNEIIKRQEAKINDLERDIKVRRIRAIFNDIRYGLTRFIKPESMGPVDAAIDNAIQNMANREEVIRILTALKENSQENRGAVGVLTQAIEMVKNNFKKPANNNQ